MKKKIKLTIATLAVSMVAATSAFAASAWDSFNATLPAKQGDTEVSTVARANTSDIYGYFTIKITSIDPGYTAVRAWAENTLGANYSDPYNQVAADGTNRAVFYYDGKTPSKGTNVVLNLDNPVYTSTTVDVSGTWTPN